MKIKDKVAVVTGGANGIGRALCSRFAAEGARGVVVADLDAASAAKTADEIGGISVALDVSNEIEIAALVKRAIEAYGAVDLFCSNAGIGTPGGADEPDEVWERIWRVNVMAHVYAARLLVPGWVARGEGYFCSTA